jgi:hypothetical protein
VEIIDHHRPVPFEQRAFQDRGVAGRGRRRRFGQTQDDFRRGQQRRDDQQIEEQQAAPFFLTLRHDAHTVGSQIDFRSQIFDLESASCLKRLEKGIALNNSPKRSRLRRSGRFLAINLVIVCLLLTAVEVVLRLARPETKGDFSPEPDAFRVFERVAGEAGRRSIATGWPIRRHSGAVTASTHHRADGMILHIEEPFPDPASPLKAGRDLSRFHLRQFAVLRDHAGSQHSGLWGVSAAVVGGCFSRPGVRGDHLSNKALDQESMLIMLLKCSTISRTW